jgi:hypothetical protein
MLICNQHYAKGWNACRAEVLAAAPQAEPVVRQAAVLVSYMDHAAFDSSKIPAGMAASLRRLREKLAAPQPQAVTGFRDEHGNEWRAKGFRDAAPQPQASAEDVERVDMVLADLDNSLTSKLDREAWQRIRADYERMGVVK